MTTIISAVFLFAMNLSTLVWIAVFGVILSLLLAVTLLYRAFRSKKKMLALRESHDNNVMQARTETQEQTYRDLSRDIHDNIGQKLSLAKVVVNRSRTEPGINLTQAEDLISDAIADMRNLSRAMGSEMVERDGLIDSIKFQAKILSQSNLHKINVEILGDAVYLESGKEIILYRVLQEGLQNVLKHSNATRLDIVLNYSKQDLDMRIIDNGTSFSDEFTHGQGLRNMDYRAKSLGGNTEIQTGKQGTTLIIKIPIGHDKKN